VVSSTQADTDQLRLVSTTGPVVVAELSGVPLSDRAVLPPTIRPRAPRVPPARAASCRLPVSSARTVAPAGSFNDHRATAGAGPATVNWYLLVAVRPARSTAWTYSVNGPPEIGATAP
jgi:hypothetical protein